MTMADLAWKEFENLIKGKNKETVVNSQYRALALRGSVQSRKRGLKQNSYRSAYGK